jgi:hypothetical protein
MNYTQEKRQRFIRKMSTIAKVLKEESMDDFLSPSERGKLMTIANGLESFGKEVNGE